ncbi:hypothetical protein BDV33DRAFT_185687 [Aspergillus novoparasiticus]|uniref:Uncharacterized protein n=1 Tax=Aspergillus novoparasiticus TaxID=986946 RepID=A0A5N6E6V5_9EURO|nr:hypothetical protein BDV33DRAFT_185687 [Aspergillus novoparasiticus]
MSIGASIFITAASVTVSIIYSLIFTCIKSFLQPLGVYPRLGQYTLAATWIATALSLGSTLLSILNACCCCCL